MSNSDEDLDQEVGLEPDGVLIEHVLVSSHSRSRSGSQGTNRSNRSNRTNRSNRSNRSSNSKGSHRSKTSSNRPSSVSSGSGQMEECEKFIEVLTDVFEQPDNVDASIYCAMSDEIQEDCDNFFVYINIFNKHTEQVCALVKYEPSEKVIHIEEIAKCSGDILPELGSGSDNVRNLIAVGDEFRKYLAPGTNLSIMIDSDQSKITVKENEIDLGWLYMFATGETWYNSLGFREAKYDSNSEFINDFIDAPGGKMTIREQFQKIKRDLKNPDIRVTIVQKYKKELETVRKKFIKSLDKAVEDGSMTAGQFRTKFSNIRYDYPEGVGFGLKKKKSKKKKSKKKRSSKKRISKKMRKTRKR